MDKIRDDLHNSHMKKSKVRWFILIILLSVDYADWATNSIAGDALQSDLGLNAVSMGYVFLHSADLM